MDLKRIVKMAELLVEQQALVQELEAEFKQAKAVMMQLEREDLPGLMVEAGLQEIKLDNGSRIVVTEDCDVKLTATTKNEALMWLIDNGFGGLIKTQVSLELGKGEHATAVKIREDLAKQYEGVELKEDVHHSTLKAFVKEQMQSGNSIPMDLFNVYPYSKAVIKR